ncbi:MAG: hypothetical protein ACAI25_12135 [Planctomycetota bacterium]
MVLAMTATLLLGGAVEAGGGPARRQIPASVFDRVVLGRVFQTGHWTLRDKQGQPNQTPDSVGDALAALEPTYVSGLVRIAHDEDMTQREVDAFDTIRKKVLAKSPRCKFDMVLNAMQYPTPASIEKKMSEISAKVKVDIWFFDFYDEAYREHGFNGFKGSKRAIEAAIAWAHRHGQWIGGNCFQPTAPPRSDFAAVATVHFKVRKPNVTALRRKMPVILHLGNNPQSGPQTECAVFVEQWEHDRRVKLIQRLAARQRADGYRFMYPVFFPEWPAKQSYDSTLDKDGTTGRTTYSEIRHLIGRYDPKRR